MFKEWERRKEKMFREWEEGKKVKVQVVRIGKIDAYYDLRHLIIGLSGMATPIPYPKSSWVSGWFRPNKVSAELGELIGSKLYFRKVLLRKL